MNGTPDVRHRTERPVPYDVELERSVLAEIVAPLHPGIVPADVAPDAFYDGRHRRIIGALRNGDVLAPGDCEYVDHLDRYARPLVAGDVERFLDLAARRRRLAEIERERLDLMEIAP